MFGGRFYSALRATPSGHWQCRRTLARSAVQDLRLTIRYELDRRAFETFLIKCVHPQCFMDLSLELIQAILDFLPRDAWRGLALTCTRFRLELAIVVLRQEGVISSISDHPRSWKLQFVTSGAFSILNRHWRLGPLFHPVDTVTFSFPYDSNEQTRCLKLACDFFRSLSPGTQHVKHVCLSLGVIRDTGDMPPSIDYSLLSSLLRGLHGSGCERLSLWSIDVAAQALREEPDSRILPNIEDGQLRLENLSIDSMVFSSPTLTPWFMRQVMVNSSISRLRLSGTGFADCATRRHYCATSICLSSRP